MNHVLEHLEKESIIEILSKIKEHLLDKDGKLLITVPNAQSNTGCYWAYEDFTHNTLFTAGSIDFVLKSAGFSNISFLDIDGTAGYPLYKKNIKKLFLWLYKKKINFWNRITSSSFHKPSIQIYTYELKVLAN